MRSPKKCGDRCMIWKEKNIEQAKNAHVVSVQVKLTQRKFADQEIPAATWEGVALSLGIAAELFGTS